jgi:hypothetical protein
MFNRLAAARNEADRGGLGVFAVVAKLELSNGQDARASRDSAKVF